MPTSKKRALDADDDAASSSEASEAPARPVKKRAKAKTPKAKGALSSFAELPLDVLGVIASHTSLGDVLSLSRVNKTAHDFLTSKRMEPVWQQARINSDLPELKSTFYPPSYMCYGELMYGTKCMSCGKATNKAPYYALYIRLCPPCSKDQVVDDWNPHRRQPYSTFDGSMNRRWPFAHYMCLCPEAMLSHFGPPLEELVRPLTLGMSQEQRAIRKEQEKELYREHEIHENDERAMLGWAIKQKDLKEAQRAEVKEARKASIIVHLREEGFSDWVLARPKFLKDPLVDVSRELTDRSREGVFAQLRPLLNVHAREEQRLRMEIKWNRLFLDDAKQKSSKVWPLPPWEEGAAFRSVQPLCQPLESASNQYPTLKSCFRALRRELSTRRDTLKTSLVQFALAAEQREADEAAAARAKAGQAPVPATIEQQNLTLWTKEEKDAYLARADLFFQCARVGAELSFGTFPVKQTCSASQTWPAILDHVCAVDKKRSCSIMSNNCRIDKTLMAFARLLVTLAGKTTASQQEVDRLGRCFSCLGCSPSFATTSRTFRQMMQHMVHHQENDARRLLGAGHSLAGSLAKCRIIYEPEEVSIARLLRESAAHV